MLHLPRFKQELQTMQGLDYHQVWRYTKAGRLPRIIAWLANHPKLAEALAHDARELAAKTTEPQEKAA